VFNSSPSHITADGQSVNAPWHRAPCSSHDHTIICIRTSTVLVVMGRPF